MGRGNKKLHEKIKALTDRCFSPHSGKNKSLAFVLRFHLRSGRAEGVGGGGVEGGNRVDRGLLGKSVTVSLVRRGAGGRKKGMQESELFCFFSVFMPYSDNFLFSYTSESLFFSFRIPSSEEVFRRDALRTSVVSAGVARRCRAEGLLPPHPSSSLVVFGFGVCEDVRLEVGGLRKLLVAAVEGADVGPVAGVDPHVRAQVKVQGEALPAALKGTLEGFLPRVNELVTFEFGALHKRLAALGADVHARAVGVEVLPHG